MNANTSIPSPDSERQPNPPQFSPFWLIGGTMYLHNQATPEQVIAWIAGKLERLGDQVTPQNASLWNETINLIYTACELALDPQEASDE